MYIKISISFDRVILIHYMIVSSVHIRIMLIESCKITLAGFLVPLSGVAHAFVHYLVVVDALKIERCCMPEVPPCCSVIREL